MRTLEDIMKTASELSNSKLGFTLKELKTNGSRQRHLVNNAVKAGKLVRLKSPQERGIGALYIPNSNGYKAAIAAKYLPYRRSGLALAAKTTRKTKVKRFVAEVGMVSSLKFILEGLDLQVFTQDEVINRFRSILGKVV